MQNREAIKRAIEKNGLLYKDLCSQSTPFYQDEALLLLALQTNATAIAHASPELRNNLRVAREVVHRNGLLLRFISTELRQNMDLVDIAINNNIQSLDYSLVEEWTLQERREKVISFYRKHQDSLLVRFGNRRSEQAYHIPLEFQEDEQVVREAIATWVQLTTINKPSSLPPENFKIM